MKLLAWWLDFKEFWSALWGLLREDPMAQDRRWREYFANADRNRTTCAKLTIKKRRKSGPPPRT